MQCLFAETCAIQNAAQKQQIAGLFEHALWLLFVTQSGTSLRDVILAAARRATLAETAGFLKNEEHRD